jgi:hypothetical protein
VNLHSLTSQPSSPAALARSSSWAIAQAKAIISVNGPGSICVKKVRYQCLRAQVRSDGTIGAVDRVSGELHLLPEAGGGLDRDLLGC